MKGVIKMIKNYTKDKTIKLGVCYYPEHWPEEMWDEDFARMKELGFSYVRMAEFAWTVFEPKEGHFEFSLFDLAIEKAANHGLKVILGTPTATPPVWLTEKYPEVLNATQEGVVYRHGARRHYNFSSDKYHELTKRIVTKMVEHYKDHPNVVGWQIDNEFNCEINVYYSEADHLKFRKWVKNKYQSLEQLNEAWGTVFWNQTYTDWSQVFLPRPTVSHTQNPHQSLDEKRFISDQIISYAKMQADIIRRLTNRQWVTTNGMFGHLDNHRLTDEVLDFYAYDSYPNFSQVIPDESKKPLKDRKWSLNLSTVRSFGGNFAVFEQQAGPGGWVNRMEQPTPKPDQLRLWTYQSIAHGTDLLLYFRWRTATMGTEIYWHGLHDYNPVPNRRVKEIEQTSREIQNIGQSIFNSKYVANVAILSDYDNDWDGEVDRWYGDFIGKSKEAWFKALQYRHMPTNIVQLKDDTELTALLNYEVLIYPHAAILTEERANLLKRYVEAGGKIILGCRTGYKDRTGRTYMKAFPGHIADLVGVTVEDFTTLNNVWEDNPDVELFGDTTVQSIGFNDVLKKEAEDVEIIGSYQGAYYDGKPALSKRKVGKGVAYYYGSVFDLDVATRLIDDLNVTDYQHILELTEHVELVVREKDNQQIYMLLNYSNENQAIQVKKEMEGLLTKDSVKGNIELAPYDVMVLK